MAKPAPTKGAKARVSLAPVKALSGEPPLAESAPAAIGPKPAAADDKPAPAAASAKASPVAPAPAAPVPAQPVAKAGSPAKPAAQAKPAVAKAAGNPPPATALPRAAVRKVAPKPEAAAEPAARLAATAAASATKALDSASGSVAEAAETFARTLPASLPPQRPDLPEFASLAAEAWMTQTLAAVRMVGAVQAKVLDHACAELKAALDEAQALAETESSADALVLQSKALRRSCEAYSAHMADLGRTVQAGLRRD